MSNKTEDFERVKYRNLAGVETYWYKNIVLIIDEEGEDFLKIKPHAKIFSVSEFKHKKELQDLTTSGQIEYKTTKEFFQKYKTALKIIEANLLS